MEEGFAHKSLRYYHGNFSRVTLENDNSGLNQKWLRYVSTTILGKDGPLTCPLLKHAGSMPILNSGVIIGTPLAITKLLYVFTALSSYLDLSYQYSAGQGLLNFAYYYGLLNTVKLKILPPLVTPFVHLTSFIPELLHPNRSYHPKNNPLINFYGRPYAIAHQIDRKHIYAMMDNWQSKTWHTEHKSCLEIDS
jgi:hypothetical protein